MSMSDPIADMLTRIRNAQARGRKTVEMCATKVKVAIAKVLKEEGYIFDYMSEGEIHKRLIIKLKYYAGTPVIGRLVRVSRPSLRVYRACGQLPKVMGGMGIAIISTSRGIVSDRVARDLGEGGEVICLIS